MMEFKKILNLEVSKNSGSNENINEFQSMIKSKNSLSGAIMSSKQKKSIIDEKLALYINKDITKRRTSVMCITNHNNLPKNSFNL